MMDPFTTWASVWAQLTPRDLDAAIVGGGCVAVVWLFFSLFAFLIRRDS